MNVQKFAMQKMSHCLANNTKTHFNFNINMDKNHAASIIQHAYRTHVANKIRSDMIARGEDWISDGIDPMRAIRKNMASLDEIRKTLDKREKLFLDRFTRTRFYATHATNADVVDNNDRLVLFSYRKLREQKKSVHIHAHTKVDIIKLANDDYVYFSLEAGNKLQKPSSRFGKAIYRIDFSHFNFIHSDLLLVDQLLTFPYKRHFQNFREIFGEVTKFAGSLNRYTIHFINGATPAIQHIALNIIKLSRTLQHIKDTENLLTINSDEDVNAIMNGIFRPEIRVPRMAIFSRGQYMKKVCF